LTYHTFLSLNIAKLSTLKNCLVFGPPWLQFLFVVKATAIKQQKKIKILSAHSMHSS